jgi:hypothetical protein
MRIHNALPHFLECLRAWEVPPAPDALHEKYVRPIADLLGPMLEDFASYGRDGLETAFEDLDWPAYRAEALTLDPAREESRLRRAIGGVEGLLAVPLSGEAVLFGAFAYMDGYARFDRGSHRVYLGADESHGKGVYLDILFSHELTHAAREPIPSVWAGWGKDPRAMSHDDFTEAQTVVEHLVNEGLACLVSERLVPTDAPWDYCYQTREGLAKVWESAAGLDAEIHKELADKDGHYYHLYDTRRYGAHVPRYAHYAWAWRWVRSLLERRGWEPRDLVHRCSLELVEDALSFRLEREPRPREIA